MWAAGHSPIGPGEEYSPSSPQHQQITERTRSSSTARLSPEPNYYSQQRPVDPPYYPPAYAPPNGGGGYATSSGGGGGGGPGYNDPYYRDPFYPQPPRDPYAGDYSRYPPPPLPPRSNSYDPYPPRDPRYYNAVYPPPPVHHQPHYRSPFPPPPPPDSSLPIVMLCRALNLDAFLIEKPKYASLELRWVPEIDDLHSDLRAASLQHPSIKGSRRRVFCSAVGGPEALVRDIRGSLRGEDADMEWREVMGLVELRRELERMNDRWRKTVEGAEERMKEREEREKCRREGREYVPPPPRDRSLSAELAENRKRARDGTDSVEPEAKRLPERKFLDTILKRPRRACAEWATKRGVTIDDATSQADAEPIIGERLSGIWEISGEPLGEVQPQIQVLMARYLRDSFNPPRLRLYESTDANKVLKDCVPWFANLIAEAKDRFDEILVGAQTPVLSPPETLANPYPDYVLPVPTVAAYEPGSMKNSTSFPGDPPAELAEEQNHPRGESDTEENAEEERSLYDVGDSKDAQQDEETGDATEGDLFGLEAEQEEEVLVKVKME